MLEITFSQIQGIQQIPQHFDIDFDLTSVAPTGDQIGLLIEGGIEDIRDAGERGRGSDTCGAVGQVQSNMALRRLAVRGPGATR